MKTEKTWQTFHPDSDWAWIPAPKHSRYWKKMSLNTRRCEANRLSQSILQSGRRNSVCTDKMKKVSATKIFSLLIDKWEKTVEMHVCLEILKKMYYTAKVSLHDLDTQNDNTHDNDRDEETTRKSNGKCGLSKQRKWVKMLAISWIKHHFQKIHPVEISNTQK